MCSSDLVFMMREWLDKDVDDICRELGITSNHCGVMLYRAHMQLRECLGGNWIRETWSNFALTARRCRG